ncbi:MAG: glycosyltransferase family 4 protein [Eubacterium sp.]|nr:glycosyltransferase family 4 protein [Eubacterium sp.]
MKIGFDISQTCEKKSGTGFYADQLIRALAHIDKENEYTLLPWFYDYRPHTVEHATRIQQKNFEQKLIKNFSEEDPVMKKLDIVHSNNFRYPKNLSAKKIVTIYDVCFMDYPEYTTEANRLFCYQGTLDAMLFADKVIAISNYTKDRLLHFFPSVPKDKVEVIYCGNRDTLLAEQENRRVLERFRLREGTYFLSVGTIEPRKNYGTLLKAYKRYKELSKNDKKLCIAGGYGWMQENFTKEIESLGLAQDVVVTEYVSDAELANLYRYCFAFLYPTWYEGFGLPVLEAMNFGKPVIVSDVTSIPEIVGTDGLLVKPDAYAGFAEYMLRLEEDQELYRCMVENGYGRVGGFQWEEAAKRVLDLYGQILYESGSV